MLSSSYRGRKVAKVRKREDKPVRPVPLGGTHGMTMLRRYAIVCIVNSAQSSAGSARGGLRNRGSQWTSAVASGQGSGTIRHVNSCSPAGSRRLQFGFARLPDMVI